MRRPASARRRVALEVLGDGSGVLHDRGTDFKFALNRSGRLVWELIAAGVAPDAAALAERIARDHGGPPAPRVESGIRALLQELEAKGLLRDPVPEDLRDDGNVRDFLRRAIAALGTNPAGLEEAVTGVADWARVLSVARGGLVASSAWSAIQARGLGSRVPEPYRSAFAEAHEQARDHNAAILDEAVAVQEAFDRAGVEALVLKGPAVILGHASDPACRLTGDVDVLVRSSQLADAVSAAHAAGAEVTPATSVVRYDGSVVGHHEDPKHLPIMVTRRGVPIEIHHELPGEGWGASGIEALFAASRLAAWKGRSLRIPSARHVVAIACLHGLGHHAEDEAYTWRLRVDLALTVGSGAVSWGEACAAAPAGRGRWTVRHARAMVEDGGTGWIRTGARKFSCRVRHWRQTVASERRGVAGLVRVGFPSRAFMAEKYGIGRWSPALPALYVWRPLRGAWRLVTGK